MTHRIFKSLLLFLFLSGMLADARAESPRFKTRALWVDASGFATAKATDKMIAKCTRAGINLILPNVFCYQTAYFKSPHFKCWVAANDDFDALAYLVSKAHAAKIQVQAWCCIYYEGGQEPSNPSWLDQSFDGQPFEKHFISPANPEVNPYLLSVMKDLLAYDIDGIHLDYIRYPCTAFDYSTAARTAFQKTSGFDPQDFLDHVEKIVPPEQESYPVRVLHAKSHIERIWETTAIERTLDQAGVGFAFISEMPENIAALRVPGLLILSSYDKVPEPMRAAIHDYAARGGDVLWSEAPVTATRKISALAKLIGISDGKWIGPQQVSLQPVGSDRLAKLVTTNAFFTSVNTATKLDGAAVVSKFISGEPAITVNQVGRGHVVVTGFDLMECKAGRAIPLVKGMVDVFKSEAHVVGPDLLAEKRAEWVQWRGDQVTQLVRDISKAAKAKNSAVVVTSSGGPGAWEFYGCYRDARRWLAEGINDEVFPMNYTPDPVEFADLIQAQAAAAPAGTFNHIFPGIQLYNNKTVNGKRVIGSIDPAILAKELSEVQAQGYQGFCLFAYNNFSEELINAVRPFSN